MKAPINRKMLIDWGGPRVFKDAEMMVDNGRVLEANYDPPRIHGSLLWNNRQFKTALEMLQTGRWRVSAHAATIPTAGLSVPM